MRETMRGEERRSAILRRLQDNDRPLSGSALSREFRVSRQVIVQDIALLRAGGAKILASSRGYLLLRESLTSRVFKVRHNEEQTEQELNLFVDHGGFVKDVFIYHKVYGMVRVPLNIGSRVEVQAFMETLRSGQSRPLSGATSGYHYHTVEADHRDALDQIQNALAEVGFLAPLQDDEPVDFWQESEEGAEGKRE
ncbi:MAG: transcription repressor NadR [Anaerovoracaceae bacterium]